MIRSRQLPVLRFTPEGPTETTDLIVIEEPLEILIGDRNLAITMRTPGHDEELAAGFLFTEGLIRSEDQIRAIHGAGNQVTIQLTDPATTIFREQDRRFTMTSACGVCGKTSIDSLYANGCTPIPSGTLTMNEAILRALPSRLRSGQAVFEQTGGLHAAGLFDAEGNLELLREDVGRHNAVDKLIGARFLTRRKTPGVLLVSGRASFELVQKAAMAGIPMVAAVGAPSTLAVETANRFNITLIGFLRHDRFNIYTGAGRVTET